MKPMSLTTLTDEQPARARSSHNGRAPTSSTVATTARCTRISWRWPKDTDSLRTPAAVGRPPFYCGHVVLTTGRDTCDGTAGRLLAIPSRLYSLDALEDSAMLVTVLTDHQAMPASGTTSELNRPTRVYEHA